MIGPRIKVNVVFSGSGVLFPIFLGILDSFSKYNIDVNNVVGTSGGALVAAASKISRDYRGLLDIIDLRCAAKRKLFFLFDLFKGKGMYKDRDLNLMLRKVYGDKRVGDFDDLFIIGTKITGKIEPVVFHKRNKEYSDVYIWQAVRASIGLPFVWDPFKIKDSYFLDGGLSMNFAIDLLPEREGERTIGVLLRSEKKISGWRGGGKDLIRIIINSFLLSQENEHIDDAKWAKVFPISYESIDGLNFDIPKENIYSMFEFGQIEGLKIILSMLPNLDQKRHKKS